MNADTETGLIAIEPCHRLVVLGRTFDATSDQAERALDHEAIAWRQLGSTCLGRGLYRHGSIFKGQSDAAVWSHAEFTYFRDFIPGDVIDHLVRSPPPPGVKLLRAEILLTTPGSFVVPTRWAGSAHRPERRPSIEYLDVLPSRLADYRDIMHRHIGPAAAKLVAMGTLGTFRSMETAAVLLQDPSLGASWNQIHLSEVFAEGFRGFGEELDAALRETVPDGRFADVFAGLNDMRTIPRWTLNTPVFEDDAGVGDWACSHR